jgi:hypothetical protein
MKKFMILHFGFEKPTPEIMAAWGQWFESIADKQVDQGGFAGGREISKDGTRELPWDMESITGYNIIEHHRSRGSRRGREARTGEPVHRERPGLRNQVHVGADPAVVS